MSDTAAPLLLRLLRQATARRRESEQQFRELIVAVRSAGLALAPIAEAAELSVARIHGILEEETVQSQPTTVAPAATADVLVVAAKVAYGEYLTYHAYVCQTGRSFRDVDRIGFYRRGQIEPHFPTILAIEDPVAFSAENAERLRATGSPVDREVADLIDRLVAVNRRHAWDTYQVFLLTEPDDPRTLTLPQPIRHDTSRRGSAWTMGQRYVNEAALLRHPTSTDELV